MSDDIALETSLASEMVEIRKAQPEIESKVERFVLLALGGVIGGLMLVSLGFLGVVTYVSFTSPPPETPRLACPPICKVEAR